MNRYLGSIKICVKSKEGGRTERVREWENEREREKGKMRNRD